MPGTGAVPITSLRQGEVDLLVGVPEIPEPQAESDFSWLMGSSSLVFSLCRRVLGFRLPATGDGRQVTALLPDFYAAEQLAAFSRQYIIFLSGTVF